MKLGALVLAMVSLAVAAAGRSAYAQSTLSDRPAYIAKLVNAVKSMDTTSRRGLEMELRVGLRGRCRAGFNTPDVRCALEVARAACATKATAARQSCRLVADIAVTNFLAEKEWVDKKTRVTIMNESDDFQAGMRKELRARYAGLVAELSMSRRFGLGSALYPAIDHFCVNRARRHVLTWSRCVAAIVWYIATSEPKGRQTNRD